MKDEMKKLREEWLCKDPESNQKPECQDALLKKERKDLEAYISSVHSDIGMLHNKEDLLQQKVSS
jgi:hypothetical protein